MSDKRPVHEHNYGSAVIPCSQDHGPDERQAGLREALETELVPWFKVRGDDTLDQGIMRRCLLCGRTSRIVSSTASPSAVDHEADCAFEAAVRAALAVAQLDVALEMVCAAGYIAHKDEGECYRSSRNRP